MRCESVFVVSFSVKSDVEARQIANRHLEQMRDELAVEGADHPYDIRLQHLYADGRDVLDEAKVKQINT